MFTSAVVISSLVAGALAQTYSATYTPSDTPNQSEQGQQGTNQCGTASNQTSMCQNAYSECCTANLMASICGEVIVVVVDSQLGDGLLSLRASPTGCGLDYRRD